VGDGNAVSVAGAVALRLTRYGQAVYATAPRQEEKAGEPGFTPSGRSVLRVLSPHNHESLPFQGREEPLARLKAWLAAPGGVSVQAVVGGGGRGKTRLAAELAAWARAQDWTAGFARRDDLDVFRDAGCRTNWKGPCLVIIDYAAAKAAEVGAWLRSLAHLENEAPPLRLLLLERTGGGGSAWWRGIFEQAGIEGEAVAELLGPGAPLTLGALSDPDERHAVFAAAYGQGTDAPLPPRGPGLDQALVEAGLGGEPLFLAMFGLVSAQQGVAAAGALAADQIALMRSSSCRASFSDLGRREEALAAVEEAAGLYRALTAARPDAFRPHLASALNNLSIRLALLIDREVADRNTRRFRTRMRAAALRHVGDAIEDVDYPWLFHRFSDGCAPPGGVGGRARGLWRSAARGRGASASGLRRFSVEWKADPALPSVGSRSVTPCRSLRCPRSSSQQTFEHGSLLGGSLPAARGSFQRKSTPRPNLSEDRCSYTPPRALPTLPEREPRPTGNAP
jgi:hypothetical protein